jgi:undecaprenyl diphosphate synthase
MTDSSSAEIPFEAGAKPRHVAIIMDGNNRWAKRSKLLGVAGHKAGVDAVRAVVEVCVQEKIEVLTLFAFSSENWRRPQDEVSALMKLFLIALQREVKKLHKNNIRLQIIGDRSKFSPVLIEHMARAELLTKDNTRMTLVIAANYGGHWDIVNSARALAHRVKRGELDPEDIDENLFQSGVSLGEYPMPDLLIRTAGEQRVSNLLLWQLAYTEFYFSDVSWPDFKHAEMQKALLEYSRRQRRFGQTDDQIAASKNTKNPN